MAFDEDIVRPWGLFLLDIAKEVKNEDELKNIKLIFGDKLTARDRESIIDSVDLFKLLEDKRLISEDDTALLGELFRKGEYTKLIPRLNEYEANRKKHLERVSMLACSKLRSSEARNTELTDEVAKLTSSVTELEQKLQESKQNAADKAGSNLSFAFLDNLDRYLDVDTKLNFDLSVHSSGTSSGETPPPTPKHKMHKFMITNFQVPAKCAHCTSLMLGQSRQGMMCEVCHFPCHVACAEKAPSMCPISQQQMANPQGIDPIRGIGTAYEGVLRIPKPGGVRKSWMKQFLVVCDFKLFLFDVLDGRVSEPPNISHILDMRDEECSVSSVLASDVIHAPSKDVPCIFKVSVSQLNPPGLCAQLLLLADSEAEKKKWVDALNNLQRHLKHNPLPDRTVFRAQEVFDSSMPLVKVTHCADIVDASRFVIGTEDGLYTVEISSGFIVRVNRKQIHQVRVLKDEQLVIVISGRGRHLRLFPIACLDGEATVIKVEEPRGCTMFTTGIIGQGSTTCMCVAMKRTVLIYEFNRKKGRHKRIKEVTLPAPAQCMEVFGGRLCAGYTSGFGLFNILKQGQHVEPLLNIGDPSLRFLIEIPSEALAAVEISNREYLLCFSTLGVYVDFQGRRTREQELMWHSHPTEIAFNSPYLIVYSDISVDIYDIGIMEWVQTIPLRGTRQLSWDGSLNLSFVTDLYAPRLVYFHNRLAVSDHEKLNIQTVVKSSKQRANKRKFSFKSKDEIRKTVVVSSSTKFQPSMALVEEDVRQQLRQRFSHLPEPVFNECLRTNPTNLNLCITQLEERSQAQEKRDPMCAVTAGVDAAQQHTPQPPPPPNQNTSTSPLQYNSPVAPMPIVRQPNVVTSHPVAPHQPYAQEPRQDVRRKISQPEHRVEANSPQPESGGGGASGVNLYGGAARQVSNTQAPPSYPTSTQRPLAAQGPEGLEYRKRMGSQEELRYNQALIELERMRGEISSMVHDLHTKRSLQLPFPSNEQLSKMREDKRQLQIDIECMHKAINTFKKQDMRTTATTTAATFPSTHVGLQAAEESTLSQNNLESDRKLDKLSKHMPTGAYTTLCTYLGIGYDQANAILARFNMDYQRATRDCLAQWKTRTGGNMDELETILHNAEVGDLVKYIK